MAQRPGADITGPADIFCPECHPSVETILHPCVRCGMPTEEGSCPSCARAASAFLSVASAVAYGGAMKQAILRLKHGSRRDLGPVLAPAFAGALSAVIENTPDRASGLPVVATPVPLHPNRLRKRGFNQALELLRAAAPAQDIPVLPDALVRRVDTLPLSELSPAERRERVSGVFSVRSREAIAGRHIILADDVMTTGATLSACATALLENGAAGVSAAVLARAI